jgi:hypothetical protein
MISTSRDFAYARFGKCCAFIGRLFYPPINKEGRSPDHPGGGLETAAP